jgi:hypothetical protein
LQVGSVTLNHLVHVKSDGAIDPAWAPNPNNTVQALALAGNSLYVAGMFTQIGGKARTGLAAVSTADTGSASDWDPKLVGSVTTIVANTTTVYVGGSFTNVGQAARANLAALSATDASALAFNPAPDQLVKALALGSDKLYVAGDFTLIGTQNSRGLAAVDLTGAGQSAFAGAIDPSEVTPDSIALVDGVLYVGGNFTKIRGMTRERLAAFNASTGELTAWAPGADDHVVALAVSGSTVYAAGDFKTIGGKARGYLAALDKQGALTDWDPRPGDVVHVLAADSNTVYASGNTVRTYGAEPHAKLAAFKQSSLTTWGPSVAGGSVNALAATGSKVYVGGSFDTIGGVSRRGLAAVDGNTVMSGWDAHINSAGTVDALLLHDSRLYAGGVFSDAGGSAHANLVALDTASGNTLSGWTLSGAAGGGGVKAFALDGDSLYLGGGFTGVGTNGPARLAAVDAATGAVKTSWTPAVTGGNAVVNALSVSASLVFVGGDFTSLGGSTCSNLGAVNSSGAQVWNGDADAAVRSLVSSGSVSYAVGDFTALQKSSMPAKSRGGLAAFSTDGTSVVHLDGMPNINGSAYALAVDATSLYLGGDILSVGGNRCRNYITTDIYHP